MANPAIGSFKWTHVTGGTLRRNERLRLLAQAILLRMTSMSSRGLHKIGMSRIEVARIDLDSIRIPDTVAARDAFELCTGTSPAFLINHCLRTYLWGALLAAKEKLQYDEELFYVAALLHDFGLTDNCRQSGRCSCFAAKGAQAAQQFAQNHQWLQPKQNALADAICLHLNIQVTKRQGMEAHLLHAGASLDVIGARYNEIHAQDRIDVLNRHPRAGFKQRMTGMMRDEAKSHSASRAGLLVGLGLNGLIRAAPFRE
jgi:predicted hydrolase (HD superfamily)